MSATWTTGWCWRPSVGGCAKPSWAVNEVMDHLRVEQHPDKTFIGRITRGFDFLGFHFSATGLSLARQTVDRFAERIHRHNAQGADAVRIGEYAKRWGRG